MICSYEDIIPLFCQSHQLFQALLMGSKLVDNCMLLVHVKTTLDGQSIASVVKRVNHYGAQKVVQNDKMSGGLSRGWYGYEAVQVKALLPNPTRHNATEVFWATSIGVSKYDLSVTSR